MSISKQQRNGRNSMQGPTQGQSVAEEWSPGEAKPQRRVARRAGRGRKNVRAARAAARKPRRARTRRSTKKRAAPKRGAAAAPLSSMLTRQLKDIYGAERQNLSALDKVARRISNSPLRTRLMRHVKETTRQVRQLEQMGVNARS